MKNIRTAVSLNVETGIYAMEAVYAAANTFSGKAFVRIKPGAKGRVLLELRAKPGVPFAAEELEGEFYNELLHHALRLKVSDRHRILREQLVAQALLSAQFSGGQKAAAPVVDTAVDEKLEKEIARLLKEADKGDYKADPLGIAVPWEKKHGRKICK